MKERSEKGLSPEFLQVLSEKLGIKLEENEGLQMVLTHYVEATRELDVNFSLRDEQITQIASKSVAAKEVSARAEHNLQEAQLRYSRNRSDTWDIQRRQIIQLRIRRALHSNKVPGIVKLGISLLVGGGPLQEIPDLAVLKAAQQEAEANLQVIVRDANQKWQEVTGKLALEITHQQKKVQTAEENLVRGLAQAVQGSAESLFVLAEALPEHERLVADIYTSTHYKTSDELRFFEAFLRENYDWAKLRPQHRARLLGHKLEWMRDDGSIDPEKLTGEWLSRLPEKMLDQWKKDVKSRFLLLARS